MAPEKKPLTSREKKIHAKRIILKIIEQMLEEDLSKEWFLKNCSYLCQADYDDVVQERSIIKLCGYPLCSKTIKLKFYERKMIQSCAAFGYTNRYKKLKEDMENFQFKKSSVEKYVKLDTIPTIFHFSPCLISPKKKSKIIQRGTLPHPVKVNSDTMNSDSSTSSISHDDVGIDGTTTPVPKQQYRICKASNKVYDITERKNFCSNECYKASNFLKAQLHSLPLYMRKIGESSIILKVLSDSNNRGSAGEEILFSHTISKNEIEKMGTKSQATTNLTSMLQEDIKNCTEHLANLEIKEKVYENTYVFGTEEPSENLDNDSDSNEEAEFSDYSDNEDKALFPNYDNLEVLSNKHMPISSSKKTALLIDPVKHMQARRSSSTKLSLDFISNVFQDWFTEHTMKYLLGEKQYYSIKADHLFKTMISSKGDTSEKLSTVKDEYIKLCLKIDKMPEEEELSDTPEINTDDPVKECKESQSNLVKIAAEADANSLPVKTNPKRRPKRKGKSKSKSVSFAPEANDKCPIKIPLEDSDSKFPEPVFPLVDSISQNTLRKQVLTNKLKSVYWDLLDVIGLHYIHIKEEVNGIVNTFSLTPNNIIFKPKQLKCIGIVLFKILTKTTLKEFDDDAQFSKLCENSLAGLTISEHEINTLVFDLISPNQVLRLQNVVK